jgi:hypothetical protein
MQTRLQKREAILQQVIAIIEKLPEPDTDADRTYSYIVLVTPKFMWNIVREYKGQLGWEICDRKDGATEYRIEKQDLVIRRLQDSDIKAYYLQQGDEAFEAVSFVEGKSYHEVTREFNKDKQK